ncbi:hypothetical protein M2T28_14320 [Elizabethkingia miricola]|uniref:hypothetical protein n=1 Tax=Elizabethkingia TaxID=308865 RepID=UPI0010C197C3|nr:MULTISPECIES: hypothetical protein [Elizabethkingia]MCL1653796.1 hypothetical protein [Elizabethkingia miricola]QCO45780.1 hypothetical protein FCS00_05120 [Elizabethkingia sp. 2-6]
MKNSRIMVVYFNRKDLVEFGNYLLSEEREALFKQANKENGNINSYEDRKREVTHADYHNWMDKKKK